MLTMWKQESEPLLVVPCKVCMLEWQLLVGDQEALHIPNLTQTSHLCLLVAVAQASCTRIYSLPLPEISNKGWVGLQELAIIGSSFHVAVWPCRCVRQGSNSPCIGPCTLPSISALSCQVKSLAWWCIWKSISHPFSSAAPVCWQWLSAVLLGP